MNKRAPFVKSASTTTSVAKTRADIMTMLERHGGTGFGYDAEGAEIIVRFTVPGAHGYPLRVAYPVNVDRVQDRLGPHLKAQRKGAPTREQAERVAWRNIYELADAAFAAAAIGATTIEEAFHAHLVVRTADGDEGRMYDYIETVRMAAGGTLPGAATIQRLLPKGG